MRDSVQALQRGQGRCIGQGYLMRKHAGGGQ
jgi:hypothetical protein